MHFVYLERHDPCAYDSNLCYRDSRPPPLLNDVFRERYFIVFITPLSGGNLPRQEYL